ncbi:hypothetical protein FAVG1_09850 [Fusarium avenaceum]|nr:hypothetical protein FAVG1_09850 [Fusarium avenaceum]
MFYFALRLGPPFRFSLLLSGYTTSVSVLSRAIYVEGQIILDVAPCEPHDQTFGYPGARTALNIPVILYGICAGAAFEQMMDLYRCSVFHYNPVDLIELVKLFQGHFLFSYWRLRQLPVLGGRAFTAVTLSTLATRLCICFIPPPVLLTGWDLG